MEKFRLLFVGGKQFNVPAHRLDAEKCSWAHYEQDSREIGRCEIPLGREQPHLILTFKDFASHEACETFKEKAKLAGIPYVQASGGFGALIEQARVQKIDLTPVLTKKEIEETKEKEAEPSVESEPKNLTDESSTGMPVVLADGFTARALVNKKKELSLIVRGSLLTLALDIVRVNGMGGGKTGGITPTEAQTVLEAMDKEIEFTTRGYHLNKAAIWRAVNSALGTRPPISYKKAHKSPKVKKLSSEEKKAARASIVQEVDAALDVKSGKIMGNKIEMFLTDISGSIKEMLRQNDRLAVLYDKIIELKTENTFFMERISVLEAEKADLQKEVRDLKTLISK